MGYPPVMGRLHTRYAPVRNSSAESKLSLLPFYLHVLGLPLAFILSQDQTLHCKILKNLTTKEINFYLLMMVLFSVTKLNLVYAVNQFQYFNEHLYF